MGFSDRTTAQNGYLRLGRKVDECNWALFTYDDEVQERKKAKKTT